MRGAVPNRSRLRGNTTRYIGMSRFFGTVISKWFAEAASSKVHTLWEFAHTPSRAIARAALRSQKPVTVPYRRGIARTNRGERKPAAYPGRPVCRPDRYVIPTSER